MSSIFETNSKDTSKLDEEIIADLPEYQAVLSTTDSDTVCKINRLNSNTSKYISIREKNKALTFLLLHILDFCIDQIHILCGRKCTSTHQFALFDEILKDRSDDLKSSIFQPIYDKNTGEPFKVAFRRRQVNKIYSDSEKLEEFLVSIRNELKEYHSFESFRNVMYDVKVKMKEAKILFQETFKNHNKMNELKLALVTQGRDSRLKIRKVNTVYSASCDAVQELLFKNLIQIRYAREYENSRFEQNKIKNERKLRELQKIISKYRHQTQKENRVHAEILRYILENQKDLKQSTIVWINKYNLGMEMTHFIVLQIKDRLDELKKYGENLKTKFEEHKQSIKDFKDYKEKKQKKEAEEQRLVDAAIKIQAWWRGTMYRHKLGPYNPNKSRKGKNKKNRKRK